MPPCSVGGTAALQDLPPGAGDAKRFRGDIRLLGSGQPCRAPPSPHHRLHPFQRPRHGPGKRREGAPEAPLSAAGLALELVVLPQPHRSPHCINASDRPCCPPEALRNCCRWDLPFRHQMLGVELHQQGMDAELLLPGQDAGIDFAREYELAKGMAGTGGAT
jgi:hypothetical protein